MGKNNRFIEHDHLQYSLVGSTSVLSPSAGKSLKIFSAHLHNRSGGSIDMGLARKIAAVEVTFTADGVGGFTATCTQKFGMVGFVLSTAATASTTYTATYYNGSTYAALTTILLSDLTSTGAKLLLFAVPLDMATTGGVYSVKIVPNANPLIDPAASSYFAARLIHFQEGNADNAVMAVNFPYDKPLQLGPLESLVPYFSTASAANCVSVVFQQGD